MIYLTIKLPPTFDGKKLKPLVRFLNGEGNRDRFILEINGEPITSEKFHTTVTNALWRNIAMLFEVVVESRD